MKTIRILLSTACLLLLALSATAQTTLNSTTLAAALTDTATQLNVASASNIAVGDTYAIVQGGRAIESGTVRAINGAFLSVSRAVVGGRKVAHASGATVYTGAPARFFTTAEPVGTCTRANETYLPRVHVRTGAISQCHTGGFWYKLEDTFNVQCRALLVADMIDQSCWTADGDYALVGATFVSTTAEAGGTLTTLVRKQTTTQACASGTAQVTALSAVSATTAAQTVTAYTLSTTGSALLYASGNRACIDFTDDTAGELAGVTVTLTLVKR